METITTGIGRFFIYQEYTIQTVGVKKCLPFDVNSTKYLRLKRVIPFPDESGKMLNLTGVCFHQ